jgi:hypothetical protein
MRLKDMTNNPFRYVAFLIFLFVFNSGFLFAEQPDSVLVPKRISSQIANLGKVQPIYMTPGLVSLIEIPGKITGIRLGNPNSLEYFQPENPDNEVTLILKGTQAKPTNLIIRSGKKKYVFDVIPSNKVHQDTLEILGSYGGPDLSGGVNAPKLIDSSEHSDESIKAQEGQKK